jgi:hypothetical protein
MSARVSTSLSTQYIIPLGSFHIETKGWFDHALTCGRYSDNEYEYRHVQLPKAMLKIIPSEYHDKSKGTLKLLWEEEWRGMGITQVRTVAR